MSVFHECMLEYKAQLKKGQIQQAYLGLMEYMQSLKSHFQQCCPDCFVSGSLYFGYMDMTYFACTPAPLQERKLKIAVVFNHIAFRFEVWLAAYNKQAQTRYWQLIRDSGWDRYYVVPTTKGMDSIVEHILVDDPDFRDLPSLTAHIEQGVQAFSTDVQALLDSIA